jgi:hypothetical protein
MASRASRGRKQAKKGVQLTLMVVGESQVGLGWVGGPLGALAVCAGLRGWYQSKKTGCEEWTGDPWSIDMDQKTG